MIFDNIKNSGMYIGVNKAFEKAFDFIVKATDENSNGDTTCQHDYKSEITKIITDSNFPKEYL